MSKKDNIQCSFCGRDKGETDVLIAGLDAHICDRCIEQAHQIVLEESSEKRLAQGQTFDFDIRKPKEIKEFLDQYMIGQTATKRAMAVAVYNHYKRLLQDVKDENEVEIEKSNIILVGETGTGKSLLAKYIHSISTRSKQPFVCINMASINPTLIESELFGFIKGSFTGANNDGKKGLFEMANGGTLFLDEIGELPMDLQAKFLHVIQEKEFTPIGSVTPVKLDIRIICATNCDLKQMIAVHKFREDLYHRLNVFELNIPPLRERIQDIFMLTSHFLNIFNKKYSRNCSFSDKAMDLLLKYNWKGNIRELSNIIERSILTSEEDKMIATNLPPRFFTLDNISSHKTDQSLSDALEDVKKDMIMNAYKEHKTTRKIAEVLDISQSQACRLIRQYVDNE